MVDALEFRKGGLYRRTNLDGGFRFIRIDEIDHVADDGDSLRSKHVRSATQVYTITHLDTMPYGLSVSGNVETGVNLSRALWVQVYLH